MKKMYWRNQFQLRLTFSGLVLILICLNTPCQAQAILSRNFYSKVSIDAMQESVCHVDSVYIDSLMMQDGSKLRFQQSTILVVEKAFIGKQCTFDAGGAPGEDGNDLVCVVIFQKLGSLTINTSGGDGEKGANGRAGVSGQSGAVGGNNGERGQDGGNGGDGGNAGRLHLHYSANGFIPSFNENRNHAIFLKYSGGKAGAGGRGGVGGAGGRPLVTIENVREATPTTSTQGTRGQNGLNGSPGSPGRRGLDGELILKKIPD